MWGQSSSFVEEKWLKNVTNYFGSEATNFVIVDHDLTLNYAKKIAGKQRKLLQVKISYNRVLEKVKDIRRKFSSGLINGTRSGSGKIV